MSVYKQALDLVASQVKTLADAIDPSIVPEAAIPVQRLDWDYVKDKLVTVCYDEDAVYSQNSTTNERDMRGYPIYVVFCLPGRSAQWDTRREDIFDLKEDIRAYYNFQRTMTAVSATSVNENQTRVIDSGPSPPAAIRAQKDVHVLTIIAWFLEPRG